MRALIQRVTQANVSVEGKEVSAISAGLLVLVGVQKGDTPSDAEYMARKTAALRIFEDAAGKMNLSVKDKGGQALVVSQFTLAGDTSRGNRPGFDGAAKPEDAKPLYEYYCDCLYKQGVPVATGIFQADMQVALINDGPVTFMLEKSNQAR